jgi:nucleotide-binding universal stress UspA family protein
MIEHILAAIDFSPSWHQSRVCLASLRVWGMKRVTLVYVMSTRYPAAPEERHRDHYETRLKAIASELAELGVDADWQIRTGEPASEIISAARSSQVGLILIGKRSRSGSASLLLGSTADEVCRRSPIPVLVLP